MANPDFDKLLNPPPDPVQVARFHMYADTDGSNRSIHHTLGAAASQAAAGNHNHDGGNSVKLDKIFAGETITGSKSSGAALNSVIALLVKYGAFDSTTP